MRRQGRYKTITDRSIAPYAFIMDNKCVKDDGLKNCYGVLIKEKSKGWRIGYLVVRDKKIGRLERHPDTLETFEPVIGKSVIALARPGTPDKPEVFLLDRPIVVKKKVWHDVAPLSKEAGMKIFENIEVATEYHELNDPIIV